MAETVRPGMYPYATPPPVDDLAVLKAELQGMGRRVVLLEQVLSLLLAELPTTTTRDGRRACAVCGARSRSWDGATIFHEEGCGWGDAAARLAEAIG